MNYVDIQTTTTSQHSNIVFYNVLQTLKVQYVFICSNHKLQFSPNLPKHYVSDYCTGPNLTDTQVAHPGKRLQVEVKT